MQQFQAEPHSKTVGWARYDGRLLVIDFKDRHGNKASTYSYDGTLLATGTNPTKGFPYSEWNRFQAATEKASHFARAIRPTFKGVKIWEAAKAVRPAPAPEQPKLF